MARSKTTSPVSIDSGRSMFGGHSGRWAGEQLLRCVNEGREFSTAALRTADTLRKDEWVHYDQTLIQEGRIRIKGVADLVAAGLTMPVANGLGKTVLQYEKVTDMNPAVVSMDAVAKSEADRPTFDLNSLPMPITHKDWFLHIRTLQASRERGEPLDTMQARVAARLITEKVEDLLFNGYDGKFAGLSIYGYTTHPDRNETTWVANSVWTNSSKTGTDILNDVLKLIELAQEDRFNGPYWLYIPNDFSLKLNADFKTNSDKTIRQRLLEIEGLDTIRAVDSLTDEVILVQHTPDVVVLVEGEPLQTIQWDIDGGMRVNFKAMTIQVPLIRSDAELRSGVQHMHT